MDDLDPEILKQFQEQLVELNEIMRTQSVTMSDWAKNSEKLLKSTTAENSSREKLTKSVDSEERVVSTHTKLMEAENKATQSLTRSMENLDSVVTGSTRIFSNLTSAVLSSEQGFKKYNNTIDAANNAVTDLTDELGPLGKSVGFMVELFAKMYKDGLVWADTLVTFKESMTQIAGVMPATTTELGNLGIQAKYSGERFAILQKITGGLGTNLASLGVTAGDGVTKFMKMADVGSQVYKKFDLLGVGQEELTKRQAQYIDNLVAGGNATKIQTKSVELLKKESIEYAENMSRLSSLTGKQADDLQQKRNAVLAREEERMRSLREEGMLYKLRREGKEGTEEYKNILSTKMARQAMRQALASEFSEKMGNDVGNVAAQGYIGQKESYLATHGINFSSYLKRYEEMAKSGKNQQEIEEAVRVELAAKIHESSADKIAKNGDFLSSSALENSSRSIVTGLDFGDPETTNSLARALSHATGQQTIAEGMIAQAKENAAAVSAAEKAVSKTTGAVDKVAQDMAAMRESERNTQAAYYKEQNEWLVEHGVGPLVEGAKLVETAMQHLTVAIGALTATVAGSFLKGGILSGARSGMLGGLGSGAAGAGATAGAVGGLARGAGAIAGRAAPIISGLMVGKDAYDWASSEGEAKKEDKYGAIGGGIGALIGGGIGALFFGAGAIPGAAIGAGIGNMAGNWLGASEDEKNAPSAQTLSDINLQSATEGNQQLFNIVSSFDISVGAFAKTVEAYAKTVTAWIQVTAKEAESRNANKERKYLDDANTQLTYIVSRFGVSVEAFATTVTANAKIVSAWIEDGDRRMVSSTTYEHEEEVSEAHKKQIGIFDDLTKSVGNFRGKLIESTEAFSDLVKPLDDLFYVLTGHSREDERKKREKEKSENYNKASGAGSTSNATTAMDFFKSQGWTNEQAAGIVGNLQQESSANLNPNARNGNMYGIAQWDRSRQAAFKKLYGKDIQDSTLQEQLQFVQHELTSGDDHGAKLAGRKLQDAKTAKEAAYIFETHYERSGGSALDKRIANAEALLSGSDKIDIQGKTLRSLVGKALTLGGGITGNIKNLDNLDPRLDQAMAAAVLEYYQKTGKMATLTSGFRYPGDQSKISSGNNPKAKPGMSRHERGLALDFNSANVQEMNSLGILSKYGLIGGVASRRGGGKISDPPHIELKAERGGVFSGPKSGYPVELHGTEMITPLNPGSALLELAKLPGNLIRNKAGAKSELELTDFKQLQSTITTLSEQNTKSVEEATRPAQQMTTQVQKQLSDVVRSQQDTMETLASKMDDLIDALTISNSHTKKIMRNQS